MTFDNVEEFGSEDSEMSTSYETETSEERTFSGFRKDPSNVKDVLGSSKDFGNTEILFSENPPPENEESGNHNHVSEASAE